MSSVTDIEVIEIEEGLFCFNNFPYKNTGIQKLKSVFIKIKPTFFNNICFF